MVTTSRAASLQRPHSSEATPLWKTVPPRGRQVAVAVVGLLAASGVAYTTFRNPSAAPPDAAVLMRVLVILTFTAAGLYAQTRTLQAQMGRLLLYAGLFSAVWLLNGSGNRVLFTIGAVASGLAQVAVAYVLLAHPVGRVRSATERRFLWWTAAPAAILWICALEVTGQPPLKTPLLQCVPHCPRNPLALASASSPGAGLRMLIVFSWLVLVCGTAILLLRRIRSASDLARQALSPVWMIATISAVLTAAYLISLAAGARVTQTLSAVDIGLVVAVPLAVLLGLALERLFMGQALTDFMSELSLRRNADPELLMANALHDPSLKIAYPRPRQRTYVDAAGHTVGEPDPGQAVAWIEHDGRPAAAITYDPELSDQERFVKAAGSAALMRLEKVQLEADLKASNAELAASRMRLVETAQNERRRLERDLHDGVQQQLVGLRIKLDLAAETLQDDPAEGMAAVASVGRQMDDVLAEVRSLARGIYPSLLHDRGLPDALSAAARGTPTPAVFRTSGIGRYREDIEIAVYYCCLEALQNIAKHAGPGAEAAVTLWQDGPLLRFEVQDTGSGFDPQEASSGAGLVNMRDRIETVGGTLGIKSRPGRGTFVRGSVPVCEPPCGSDW
jgi:signal transduction histidine kinase